MSWLKRPRGRLNHVVCGAGEALESVVVLELRNGIGPAHIVRECAVDICQVDWVHLGSGTAVKIQQAAHVLAFLHVGDFGREHSGLRGAPSEARRIERVSWG